MDGATAQRYGTIGQQDSTNGRVAFLSLADPRLERQVGFHEFTHVVTGFHAREAKDPTKAEVVHTGVKHSALSRDTEVEGVTAPSNLVVRVPFEEVFTDQISRRLFHGYEDGEMPNFTTMTVEQFFERSNEPDNGELYANEYGIVKQVIERIPAEEQPIQKILAMHFEYYDQTAPEGSRAPAHKAFWQMVHKYTNLVTVDKIMATQGVEAAQQYLDSAKYQVDLLLKNTPKVKEPPSDKYRYIAAGGFDQAEMPFNEELRTNHRRAEGRRFTQSVREMRKELPEDVVKQHMEAMKASGLSDTEIKKTVSRMWHPDSTGGDAQKEEYLKIANDLLRRRRDEANLAEAQPSYREDRRDTGDVNGDTPGNSSGSGPLGPNELSPLATTTDDSGARELMSV